MTLDEYLAENHFSPSFQEFVREDGENYRGVAIVPTRTDQWKSYRAFGVTPTGGIQRLTESGYASKSQAKRDIDFYKSRGWA